MILDLFSFSAAHYLFVSVANFLRWQFYTKEYKWVALNLLRNLYLVLRCQEWSAYSFLLQYQYILTRIVKRIKIIINKGIELLHEQKRYPQEDSSISLEL